uniref:Right handed beta helix domain-containing protein n=1 Tax=Aureoumbra lagunensis TaxID=44058 RepID=A0A7S3NKP9_9STRA
MTTRVWDSISLVRALNAAATKNEDTIIELEEAVYEVNEVKNVKRGKIYLRGPELGDYDNSWEAKVIKNGWRASVVGAVALCLKVEKPSRGAKILRIVGAVLFAKLGEVWLRRWRINRRRKPGGKRARIMAKDGLFEIQGDSQLRLERISIASFGFKAAVRVERNSKIHITECDLGCAGGNGLELSDDAEASIELCAISNCGRSGILLCGSGAATLYVSKDCIFSENKRFGMELQGGKQAIVESSNFKDCGICISDRGTWQAMGQGVIFRHCVLEGRSVCLPGLSIIGDGVPKSILIDTCTIIDVSGTGFYSLGNHCVTLKNCLISGATMAGIEALRGSQLRIYDSRIIQCNGAVVMHRDAQGSFYSCFFSRSEGGAVGIFTGARCNLSHCTIANARGVGLQVCQGNATISNCRILNNGETALCLGGRDIRSRDHRRRPSSSLQKSSKHPSSRLCINDCYVRGSGNGALLVIPHTPDDQYDSNVDAVQHYVFAQDSIFHDVQASLRFDAPADGYLAGNQILGPLSLTNWSGTTRLSWKVERLLHIGSRGSNCGLNPASPLRLLHDPVLIRLIVLFAAGGY